MRSASSEADDAAEKAVVKKPQDAAADAWNPEEVEAVWRAGESPQPAWRLPS